MRKCFSFSVTHIWKGRLPDKQTPTWRCVNKIFTGESLETIIRKHQWEQDYRETSNGDAGATRASANPKGNLTAGMALQRYPETRQESQTWRIDKSLDKGHSLGGGINPPQSRAMHRKDSAVSAGMSKSLGPEVRILGENCVNTISFGNMPLILVLVPVIINILF